MEKNDNILVTGANGLVGSYIIRYLIKLGYNNITGVRRPNSNLSYIQDFNDQIKWVTLDLLEADYLMDVIAEMKYIFHAAAMVSFDPSQRLIMYRSNVEGTANVVNACLNGNVKNLIFISSIASLGRSEDGGIINERTEWQESPLNSDYGKSKLLAELEVWRGGEEGLDIAIVNPSTVLGAGDWSRSSLQIFGKVAKGFPYYPNGSNGFVDVRDVAELAVKMVRNNITNERIILSGYNLEFRDIMGLIARHLNVKPPHKPLSNWMEKIFPLLEKVRSTLLSQPPLLTRATMRTVTHYSKYDNSKSLKLLYAKYRPIESTIKECARIYSSGKKEALLF